MAIMIDNLNGLILRFKIPTRQDNCNFDKWYVKNKKVQIQSNFKAVLRNTQLKALQSICFFI